MKLVNPENMHKPKVSGSIRAGRLAAGAAAAGLPRMNQINEPVLGGDILANQYGTR